MKLDVDMFAPLVKFACFGQRYGALIVDMNLDALIDLDVAQFRE